MFLYMYLQRRCVCSFNMSIVSISQCLHAYPFVFAHSSIHEARIPHLLRAFYTRACIRTHVQLLCLSISIVLSPPHHCRHTLAKPKVWKLGATETISLTIYDWQYRSRFVDAILYVRVCTCVNRPQFQRRCREDSVFSKTRVQASPGT